MTLFLIVLLGGVFLKGFTEAIGIAVGLVAVYLTFKLVVVSVALEHLVANPQLVVNWKQLLTTSHSSPWPWWRSPCSSSPSWPSACQGSRPGWP